MKAANSFKAIFMVLVSISLLFFPVTAFALPKPSPEQPPASNFPKDHATDLYTTGGTTSPSTGALHQLTKRHDYTLICSTTDASGVSHDDIPLSRRCLGEPYKYRCDKNGQPDIADGGRTLEECDRKCDCKDVRTALKPRYIRLGAGSQDGYYWCW